MALDKTTYAASIKSAFLAAAAVTNPANFDAAMTALSDAIANAGDVFVKSGTVTTTVTGTLPDGAENATGDGGVT